MMNQNQNPKFDFEKDGLFCDEQEKDLDFGYGFGLFEEKVQILKQKDHIYTHFEHDLLWEEDELFTLLGKETKNVGLRDDEGLINDRDLMVLRKESVDWIIRVSNHYGFVAMTTILAINYFDRFLFSPNFQGDKPWMNQLAAVACLSLASKVEEIQPPLLMDLQVEGTKFVFESKTIMKMELLVLSSLEWKMNPVTPFSFLDYIMRRLGLITHYRHSEIVTMCERLVLAVINDSRFLDYLPSVMAAATMLLVIQELDPNNAFDYKDRLKRFLEISEEKVEDCSEFLLEVSDNIHGTSFFVVTRKRKYNYAPASPNGVIDSCFSNDNSSDSWTVAAGPSVSSSPEPVLKKIRAQEQQMRLVLGIRGSTRTLNSTY
ncbi:cyclin-D3-3-like [Rutidosis leptorrhynchoides]|uniref:cyclin-D3-3-like n=1 Tax=Rutidosis leptorrhynchoides TaxID=125765 RepID=UPI003A99DAF0